MPAQKISKSENAPNAAENKRAPRRAPCNANACERPYGLLLVVVVVVVIFLTTIPLAPDVDFTVVTE